MNKFIKKIFGVKETVNLNNFIELFRATNRNTIDFKSAINLLTAFYACPPLYYSIVYIANCISKINPILTNGKKTIENHPVLDLFNNPNELQSYVEWTTENIAQYLLFGNSYENYFSGIGYKQPQNIYNFPHHLLNAIDLLGNGDFRTNKIVDYKFIIDGLQYTLLSESILHRKTINLFQQATYVNDSYIFGRSKVISLNKAVNAIIAGLTTEEFLYAQATALGIFTGKEGNYPVTGTDVKQLQENIDQYGLGKGKRKYIVAQGTFDYKAIPSPIKEMFFNENYNKNARIIYNTFGIPEQIFSSDNSTFENQKAVEKRFWQVTIKPLVVDLWNDRTNYLKDKFNLKDYKLVPDFSSIIELQDDEKELTDLLDIQYKSNVISKGEYRSRLGLSVENNMFNEYFNNQNGNIAT